MNKFDAAKEFCEGFAFAVCRMGGPARWDNELFMAGYRHGQTVKDSYYDAMNKELAHRGYETIKEITTANT